MWLWLGLAIDGSCDYRPSVCVNVWSPYVRWCTVTCYGVQVCNTLLGVAYDLTDAYIYTKYAYVALRRVQHCTVTLLLFLMLHSYAAGT